MITKETITKSAKKKDPKTIYELRLTDMKLTQLDNLEELVKLRELDLSRNQLKDVTAIACLKELRSLNLSSNAIVEMPQLKLAYLQKLDLSYNAIVSLKNLSHSKKLIDLNLCSNSIEKVDDISGLTELKSLDLSGNKIAKIDTLTTLTRLEQLTLNYLPLNNPINCRDLSKLAVLEKLNVTHCGITDPNFIASFSNLLVLLYDQHHINTYHNRNSIYRIIPLTASLIFRLSKHSSGSKQLTAAYFLFRELSVSSLYLTCWMSEITNC